MKRTTKRIAYNIVIFAMLIAGITIVCYRLFHFGNVEYTDNATVCQHITPVNTRVPGFIREIRFEEYTKVKAGDTLVLIEDAEFQLRVAQAEADLANAQAGHKATTAGIATTANNMAVNDATIAEAKAQMENARREEARFAKLLQEDAVTQQQYDNIHTAYVAAKARYDQMSRSKQSTALVKNEQTVRLGQTDAAIRLCEANVRLARLNLSYCAIIATCDGVTGRKDIHVGQLVQPGQTMVDIVDSKELWVQANYRESQIPNIHVGSKVRMTVDAVPGIEYTGIVESLSDATGSAFSMMPSDNATGNFVKIEQRLPVRISLKGNDAEAMKKLKAGYNVQCEVKNDE
ncbi:MAG: HlyD family secretion protein [Prevotella sp.]